MAKQRRPAARAAATKTAARTKRPKVATAAKRTTASSRKRPSRSPVVVKIGVAYAKAVALYEKGLKALQRHRYDAASTAFRQLFELYPDERELHERARLYIAVCERATGPRAKPPKGADERILAATFALNRHDVDDALALLRTAAATDSSNDHVQYMLALAHAQRADANTAGRHLSKAIALNPRNRLNAKHEPDFDPIRGSQPFLDAIKTP